MPIPAYLAIVLVVWLVTVMPEGPLRGFVYALPIPISIALASTPQADVGTQVLGVPLLVAFFITTAVLDRPLGRVGAVLCALAGVVGVGAAVNYAVSLTWPVAYALAGALWLIGVIAARVLWPRTPDPRTLAEDQEDPPSSAIDLVDGTARPDSGPMWANGIRGRLLSLGSALLATAVSFMFGSLIGPFVVTFPYSGVPVAILLRTPVDEFARDFAVRSILLTAFLAGYHESLRFAEKPLAMVLAWGVYLAGSGLLALADPRARERAGRALGSIRYARP